MLTTPNRGYPIPDPADAIHPAVRDALIAIDTDVDSLAGGGMSNPMTTLGDIIRGGSAGAPQRLAIGSAGQVLTVVSGEAAWANPAALDADLTAIAALTGTGFAKRTGADTWSLTNPTASDVGLGNVTNDAQLKIASNLSDLANAGTARTNLGVAIGSNVQAWDADLDAIAALAGTSGLLRKTGADTWTLDTATYLTANQTITLSGDVSGSGATSITTTIGAGVVTNAMLAGSIAYSKLILTGAILNADLAGSIAASKLVGTDIATVGTLTAGATGAGFTVALSTSTITGTLADARLSANVAFRNAANSFAGHQTPAATDTYDLGSSTLLWRKGWLSELDAVLFAQNTISVIGGWLVVTKDEGTVEEDVDTSETQIDFGANNITANDFIVFRSAGVVEYMQATSLVSGTVWNVTRNVDGSGANAWPQGSVWVNFGYNGTGRIELNANSTPRLSMIRQGTSYNTQTELLRVGDLNGWGNYATEIYGFATGDPSAANITIDATNGVRIRRGTTDYITLTSTDAQFTNLIKMTGANAAITIGATPPTSATVGTGLWLDRTGLYGLQSSVQQVVFDAATGKLFADAGKFIIDNYGIKLSDNDTSVTGVRPMSELHKGMLFYRSAVNPEPDDGTNAFARLIGLTVEGFPSNNSSTIQIDVKPWGNDGGEGQIFLSAHNYELTHRSTLTVRSGTSADAQSVGVTTVSDLTNVSKESLGLFHETTGTSAAGFGSHIAFALESATGAVRDAGTFGCLWTTATDASRTSAFVIQTVNNAGSLAEVARFAGNGDATFTGLLKAGSAPTSLTDSTGKILSAALNTVAVAQGGTGDTGTAYTAWTPTVASSLGSFTTVSASGRYKTIGKTVFFSLRITITDNNTAAGNVQVTNLPFTAANTGWFQIVSGRETTATGSQLNCAIQSNSTTLYITKYDATYPGASGYTLDISGTYESA